MTVDESWARLESLRERVRALEEGIRTLQARLAAWDRCDDHRAAEPAREAVVAPMVEVVLEP